MQAKQTVTNIPCPHNYDALLLVDSPLATGTGCEY
jgi:hypothetical protein